MWRATALSAPLPVPRSFLPCGNKHHAAAVLTRTDLAGRYRANSSLAWLTGDDFDPKQSSGGGRISRRSTGVEQTLRLALDLIRDLGEVEDGAGEAVDPCDNELVALADECQCLSQRLTLVAGGAALLLFEDLLAAVGLELVELGFEFLPDGRDAGASDFHGYQMC